MTIYKNSDKEPWSSIEKKVINFWEKNKIFEKSLDNNIHNEEFIFYDGPPFANGLPHYGHLLTGFVKDVFARYQTMQGKLVNRRFGWDCHGLPAEMSVEKKLGISGHKQIIEYGINKFNTECRNDVMQYSQQWKDYISRQARWVDFINSYKTMDKEFMESVIWAFKKLYDKGLIYENYKVVPYSWACQTTLSNFETKMDNSYREKKSKTATIGFEILNRSNWPKFNIKENNNLLTYINKVNILAWTTTPWTLPSNLALAISGNVIYKYFARLDKKEELFIASKLYADSHDQIFCNISALYEINRLHDKLDSLTDIEFNDIKAISEGNPIGLSSIHISLGYCFYSINHNMVTPESIEYSFKTLVNTYNEIVRDITIHKINDTNSIIDKFDIMIKEEFNSFINLVTSFIEMVVSDTRMQVDNKESKNFKSQVEYMVHVFTNISDAIKAVFDVIKNANSDIFLVFKNFIERSNILIEFLTNKNNNENTFFVIIDPYNVFTEMVSGFSGNNTQELKEFIMSKNVNLKNVNTINLSIAYRLIQNHKYILHDYSKSIKNEINSNELIDIQYKPLFDYFVDRDNCFKVLNGDFVTDTEGTGIVHIAPGFGEDDFVLCKNNNIELVCPVDEGGKFTNEINDFQGIHVFDANQKIIDALKSKGCLLYTDEYIHNYPHCWRTDTPLIYKAVSSWYVKVSDIKDKLIENNLLINWIPDRIREGQFGKWLEGARDWAISRNRFWGTPIPVWKSNNPDNDKLYIFGSIKDMEEFFDTKLDDLHRPYIDNLTKKDPYDNKYTIKRIEDVFDCWFESGSMPFASKGFPYNMNFGDITKYQDYVNNMDEIDNIFINKYIPADFIVEYISQTRGWFYTLMVMSVSLFDTFPFKNCICHGVILDVEGKKLSKRLNNYIDPLEIFDQYGSEPLRFLMLSSPVMYGENLLVDKDGAMIKDTHRLVINPIINAVNFFCLYINIDKINVKEICYTELLDNAKYKDLDVYILQKLNVCINHIKLELDAFLTGKACARISDFIDSLNNWYIRRSRKRFWETIDNVNRNDKINAYNTLFTVLKKFSIAISPLLPIVSEYVWQIVEHQGLWEKEDSVHLQKYLKIEVPTEDDNHFLYAMECLCDIARTALAIRNEQNIRIRQPLNVLSLYCKQDLYNTFNKYKEILTILIKEEINVHNIILSNDFEQIVEKKVKLNFSVLGKRLPHKIKHLMSEIKKGEWKIDNNSKLIIGDCVVNPNEYEMLLFSKDKGVRATINSVAIVKLDLQITDSLYFEGIARDFVRIMQNARKDQEFNINDRITIYTVVKKSDKVFKALNHWSDYIKQQLLCEDFIIFENEFNKEDTLSLLNSDFQCIKIAENVDIEFIINIVNNS